jgi:hypothetical protein
MSGKIIPEPKRVKDQNGVCKLGGELYLLSSAETNYIPEEINKLLKSKSVLSGAKGFFVVISKRKNPTPPAGCPVKKFKSGEHYFLRVTRDKILILAAAPAGLQRAFATLLHILRQEGDTPACREIEDWPDLSLRGAMVCLHNTHDFMPHMGLGVNGFRLMLDKMFEAKLNCLLTEYEAMYPWSGKHSVISCKDALKEEDVRLIIKEAKDRGIEIIPLVQTLGHVYHLLIHEEYRHCAESPEHPQQLCPLKEESFNLARELVDDTIRLHPESRLIHLGGDECRQLGGCPECAAFAAKHGKNMLHSQFYRRLTDYVVSKGLTPVIWHDIAIKEPGALKSFDKRAMFHFWNYGDISHGPMEPRLSLLREKTGAERIIGGSAARGEGQHGAVMPSARIIQRNIMEMNSRMRGMGAAGSIMTDWPDSGIPFMASVFPLFMQGEFAWNADTQRAVRFRENYTSFRFGRQMPEILEMQDAVYGLIPFAPGFQLRLKHHLDRYKYAPYDFTAVIDMYAESMRARNSGADLYQLFHKRIINAELIVRLEEALKEAALNRGELEAQLLAAKTNILFLSLTLGAVLARGLIKGGNNHIQSGMAVEWLKYYLDHETDLREEFSRVYGPFVVTRHLRNYLDMLLNTEIREGARALIEKLSAIPPR